MLLSFKALPLLKEEASKNGFQIWLNGSPF